VRVRRIILAAVVAVTLIALSGCSIGETALFISKAPEKVTFDDQVAATLAWREVVHYNPTLLCIRAHESGYGGYPYNAGYGYATGNGYYGAYQYLPGTWNAAARAARSR
jgi:hypothetical protein